MFISRIPHFDQYFQVAEITYEYLVPPIYGGILFLLGVKICHQKRHESLLTLASFTVAKVKFPLHPYVDCRFRKNTPFLRLKQKTEPFMGVLFL